MNALLAGSLVDSLVKSPVIAALMASEAAALLAGEPVAFFAGKVPLPRLACVCHRLLRGDCAAWFQRLLCCLLKLFGALGDALLPLVLSHHTQHAVWYMWCCSAA